jgi:quercetin dioxygenase-like cupin family protein
MLLHSMTIEGYQVLEWSDEPGMVYGSHSHGENQPHWVTSGSLELTVQGVGTFVLETGDRDFMPAGTYHSARVIGEEPVMYLIGAKH